MKPPITSAQAMSLFLYCREKMNEETSLMKWQKEKEKATELKKQIIEILQWELKEDLKKSLEDEDE
tara:strand:- start:656 stop:853 length:198 start_codon:yes stop_codon:yes gene_type:complete